MSAWHYYNRSRPRVSRRTGIPKRSINPVWKFLLPVFAIWLLLYGSYALSRPSLPNGPGTLHAEIARQMVDHGDWKTLYPNRSPGTPAARLLDWSMAASYKLLGVSDWAARLPLALCILALAITLFFFARKLFDGNAAGFYAALFFLSWPGTFLATRDLTVTPLLCLEITLIAFALWQLLLVAKLSASWSIGLAASACALVLLTAPWPWVVIPAAVSIACWALRRSDEPAKRAQWLLTAWAAWAFVAAGVLEGHLHGLWHSLGPLPPLAMLLAGWLASQEAFSPKAAGKRVAFWIFLIGVFVAAAAVLLALHGPLEFTAFANIVLIAAPANRVPLFIAAVALVAGVTGNLLYRHRNQARIANCFLAGAAAGLIVAIQVALVLASPYFSSQILAEAIRPELEPSDTVLIDGNYDDASSMVFYLERPVLATASSTVALDQLWNGPSRVFLWTSEAHPLSVPGDSYVVARSGSKEILSNQPNSGGASF